MRILHRERVIILILVVGVLMRLNDLTHAGHLGDMVSYNVPWAQTIQQFGLFKVYVMSAETNYPPIFLFILWLTSSVMVPAQGNSISLGFIILTKLFSVLAELTLIAVVYQWIPRNTRLKWIIPLILAIHPGLIATTAFWGQTDSILVLLLIMSIIALNRNQSFASWIWFSAGMLMKFQAIVLLPMLGILSIRRFGIRATIYGILVGSLIFGAVLFPFIFVSGTTATLRPFTGATDVYPVVTANAYNLWYLVMPQLWHILPTELSSIPSDTTFAIAHLTMRQISLVAFASYVLVVVIMMWRQYRQPREFIWAAALYMGFFMLPTQMHERYLYPAAVFSVIAIVQERRIWPIAVFLAVSYTINIVAVPNVDFYWLGLNLKALLSGVGLIAGVINLLGFAGITLLVIRNKQIQGDKLKIEMAEVMA